MSDASTRAWRTHPVSNLRLVRGDGSWVYDAAGNRYLDLLCGTWCAVLGHGHPSLRAAIADQAAKLVHTGPPVQTDEFDEALARFAEILPPPLDRVVLLNTGSEAVELALKMARAARRSNRLAVVERSYYGATISALSLSEIGRSAAYLPHPLDLIRLPAPDCARCPVGAGPTCAGAFPCLSPLDALRASPESGEPLAAVIYEPVLANAGIVVPPIGYGARLRSLATAGGALVIAEEVTTGIGRTGRWFGFEHDAIVPDLLVLGKALGGGFPVSAVVTTSRVENAAHPVLRHVQSHQNDPFSARIAATVIGTIQRDRLIERAASVGHDLRNRLADLVGSLSGVHEVRGRGMMIGIELQPDRADRGPQIADDLLRAGYIVDYQPQNRTFRLFPPYVVPREEIDRFPAVLARILRDRACG